MLEVAARARAFMVDVEEQKGLESAVRWNNQKVSRRCETVGRQERGRRQKQRRRKFPLPYQVCSQSTRVLYWVWEVVKHLGQCGKGKREPGFRRRKNSDWPERMAWIKPHALVMTSYIHVRRPIRNLRDSDLCGSCMGYTWLLPHSKCRS